MAVQKTSIALPSEDLEAARTAAAAEGLSLSAFLSSLIRERTARQAKIDAMGRYLAEHASAFRLRPGARAAVEAEWTAPLKPVRSRRKRRAA
jgi:hypothetical protein